MKDSFRECSENPRFSRQIQLKIKALVLQRELLFFVRFLFNHFEGEQDGNDNTADYVDFYENRNDTKNPADNRANYGNPTGDESGKTDKQTCNDSHNNVNDKAN